MLRRGVSVRARTRALIENFARSVKTLYVIEELEPIFEEQIRAWGIECRGKELTGRQGELSTRKVMEILGRTPPEFQQAGDLPARPPVMCPGCPHRGTYYVLGKLKLRVTGDIGCYTLGALKPTEAMDACLCMGASIGMSHGLEKATGGESARNTVAVIGDSTFVHSGITGLVNAVYNHGHSTIMILDNSTTAMTGHQPNPTVGYDTEIIYMWVATGLHKTQMHLDDDEFLTPDRVPLQKAYEMVMSGEIKDGKTIAGVLKLKALLDEGKL